MLLKDLKQGQRFQFTDRLTQLVQLPPKGPYTATGTFVYHDVAPGVCPILLDELTGRHIEVIHSTFFRDVLIIF